MTKPESSLNEEWRMMTDCQESFEGLGKILNRRVAESTERERSGEKDVGKVSGQLRAFWTIAEWAYDRL